MHKTTTKKLASLFRSEAEKPSRRERQRANKSLGKGPGATQAPADRMIMAHKLVAASAAEAKASFVSVSTPDSKGEVKVSVARGISSDREYARTMLGTRPIKAQLVQEFAVNNNTVNTAYQLVLPADVTLAGDIASWLNLFDEMRMMSLELLAMPFVFSQSATTPIPMVPMTIAFDPDQSTAVSSNQANIKATKHLGPMFTGVPNGVTASTNQNAATYLQVSEKGHLSLKSGPLPHSVLPISSGGVLAPNPVQGAWVPTNTASAVGGYFKYYAPAVSSISWSSYNFIIFDVEFRMRG